jgi:hypothetical protein
MTTPLVSALVEELTKKLGDRPFFTAKQLAEFGLFGTVASVYVALNKGSLQFIRISPRRRIIPKIALIAYLENMENIACRHEYERISS